MTIDRALVVLGLLALVAVAFPVKAALPPAYGGVLRISAPAPIGTLDPAAADGPFEASLARAVSDTLYRVRGAATEPFLAAAPPVVEGLVARVRLRSENPPARRRRARRLGRRRVVARSGEVGSRLVAPRLARRIGRPSRRARGRGRHAGASAGGAWGGSCARARGASARDRRRSRSSRSTVGDGTVLGSARAHGRGYAARMEPSATRCPLALGGSRLRGR